MTAALTSELAAAYHEEAALYTQALRLAEQWSSRAPEAGEQVLAQIMDLLADVQGIEDRLTPLKTKWHDIGSSPTGALAETLAQVADLIRNLQCQLDRVRQQTHQQKNELAPELDDVIRREHMRRAYGCSRPSSTHFGGSGDGR